VGAAWALVRAGFRRHASYRSAILAGALTNSVFGILRASILTAAIASAGGELGGYAAASAVTYAWITQALIAPINIFTWDELALRVRSGDIAIDLARPVDLQVAYAAADAGRAAAIALPRAVPPLAIGAATFGLVLPHDPLAYVAGIVAAGIGVAISFSCRYLVNLAAIWLLDVRGMLTVYVTVSSVLCGLVVPVHWFPGWLATVAAATPFPSMLQAPADVLSGRVTGPGTATVLMVQLAWLAGTVAAGRVVQRAGARRLVVQGG
jgi:ABC-2 type transport system permease protein